MICSKGVHYFRWSAGTTGSDPGPEIRCQCGATKRGDVNPIRDLEQQLSALRESSRLMAAHFRALHDNDHLAEWEDCEAPWCEDARALLATPATGQQQPGETDHVPA